MKKNVCCVGVNSSLALFLLFFLTQAFAMEGAGLDGRDCLKRVAVIQIVPYDPLKDSNEDVEVLKAVGELEKTEGENAVLDEYHAEPISTLYNSATDALPDGFFERKRFGSQLKPERYEDAFGLYLDPFGFGRTCLYSSVEAGEFTPHEDEHGRWVYPEESHGWYLRELVRYRRDNFTVTQEKIKSDYRSYPLEPSKNLLVVRMKMSGVTDSDDGIPIPEGIEYVFGVFVSGGEKKSKPPKSFDPISSASWKGAQKPLAFADREFLEESYEFPLVEVLQKAIEAAREPYKRGEKTYRVQLFPKGKLVPKDGSSNTTRRDTMENRLFPLEPKFDAENEGEASALHHRSLFADRLFGKPLYLDTGPHKACFSSGLDTCFNQSEQTFLDFISAVGEGGEINLKDGEEHLSSIRPFPKSGGESGKYSVEHLDMFFYSTLDICRYCRGTLSYLLHNDFIKSRIIEFFERGNVSLNIGGINVYAFSNEQTNTA